MLSSVYGAKALRKTTSKTAAQREKARLAQHQQAATAKLTKGLAGVRLGRHTVPEGEVVVQLSEDLSESLRGLKVRGHPASSAG